MEDAWVTINHITQANQHKTRPTPMEGPNLNHVPNNEWKEHEDTFVSTTTTSPIHDPPISCPLDHCSIFNDPPLEGDLQHENTNWDKMHEQGEPHKVWYVRILEDSKVKTMSFIMENYLAPQSQQHAQIRHDGFFHELPPPLPPTLLENRNLEEWW